MSTGCLTRQGERRSPPERSPAPRRTRQTPKRLDCAQELARAKRVTIAQLALAWVLHHPLELYPLVAAYHPREFEQLTKALEIELTQTESEWLD